MKDKIIVFTAKALACILVVAMVPCITVLDALAGIAYYLGKGEFKGMAQAILLVFDLDTMLRRAIDGVKAAINAKEEEVN